MHDNGFDTDSLIMANEFKSIRFQKMRAIGMANGMFKDNMIDIFVNPTYWRDLNPAEKLFVIYHEAGHDAYFRFHGTSWIMCPSRKSCKEITFEKLWKEREDYFNSIREDRKPVQPRIFFIVPNPQTCLLYTSPSPRDS